MPSKPQIVSATGITEGLLGGGKVQSDGTSLRTKGNQVRCFRWLADF
jgi:hypothetical protein